MDVDSFLLWAHHSLLESEKAREYFQGRGISMTQMEKHSLGYVAGEYSADPLADPGHKPDCDDREKKHLWCDTCRYLNWSSVWEAPEEGGPKQRVPGKRIIDSVVFPLTSYSGQRVGFQIRSLSHIEYDTFAISSRPECYFFGGMSNVQAIWDKQEVIVVEGPGDHLITERLVAENVIGLTTSGASKAQLRFMTRFAKRVILMLDMDEAGRKGVSSFIGQHSERFEILNVRYPCLQPKDKDPGDYWKRVGDDAYRRFFRRALSGA